MDLPLTLALAAGISVLVAVIFAVVMRKMLATANGGGAAEETVKQLQLDLQRLGQEKAAVDTRLAVEAERASNLPLLQSRLQEHEAALARLGQEKASVERNLAAASAGERNASETIQRLDASLKQDAERSRALAAAKEQLEKEVSQQAATLREKLERVSQLETELRDALGRLDAANLALGSLQQAHATLEENHRQSQKQADEKIALLNEARESMSKEFKVLAEEVMRTHGETITKQNKEQMDGLLTPLQTKMSEFQQGLQIAHTESEKERARLAEQIRTLSEASARMTSETSNLTRALKGETRTQGAWGEMILETILERSGLREGTEYITQQTHTNDEGRVLRPDVIVNLPNDQRIVIDAKVSLKAFEAYVNAETEEDRARELKLHQASILNHIKILSDKAYQAATGSGLDYVIMFVPIEGALAVALEADPSITSTAATGNVAIATPTTLMIALRTVANVWTVERRNRNAEVIADRAGKLYDKFVGFVEDMRKLGSSLSTAQTTYDGALGKLSLGPGNLVGQVETLKKLGAKARKSLPKELLDDSAEALDMGDDLAALAAPETLDG